jgi:FkbM family methyltransferase
MRTPGVSSLSDPRSDPRPLVAPLKQVTIKFLPFDQQHYQKLIRAREEAIRNVLHCLSPALGLKTALDAGAGVGFFSQTLADCGLSVRGFDGRSENVAEARKRFPHIPFELIDLEDRSILALGKFDLVLCFGLLYHLENPLLAVRHLRALTEKCLLLESMCVPDDKPTMLLREEPRECDQSLTDVACYPSEDSLIKMLYRAGFSFVYRLAPLPKHDDFCETFEHRRKRTVLLASSIPIDLSGFRLCTETHEKQDPWTKVPAFPGTILQRISRFLALPAAKKYLSLARHVRTIFPGVPIPWRLPFGAWWLARDGELDHKLVEEGFERAELRFVERLLRPGMTVLDIGAHHGLYTLLCSKCVGRKGQVVAFEASPRECRRLAKHVRINACGNVRIEPHAVGSQSGSADLFVVNGACNWGNSLRAPVVFESTFKIPVQVCPVDDVLLEMGISRVDFIKLDVEGAELSALKGTARLLRGVGRPAILVEVQDLRTGPWGYPSRAIVEYLNRAGYRWFELTQDGSLRPTANDLEYYDANLVALPREREREFRDLVERKTLSYSGGQYWLRSASSRQRGRQRGIEILKSMVRVRTTNAKIERPPA